MFPYGNLDNGVLIMLYNEMAIFYYVVETGSFTKAANHIHASKSFVSKKIRKLEHELHIDLLQRDSHRIRLTSAGEQFFKQCKIMVQAAQTAYSDIEALKGNPSGTLKISLPPAVSQYLISPLLTKFMTDFPQIQLQLNLESQLVNMLQEGYDLIIRSAKLNDSNLIAKKILAFQQVICVSPKYLQKIKATATNCTIEQLHFILYNNNEAKITLLHNRRKKTFTVQSTLTANNLDLMKSMVLDGCGAAIFPDYVVAKELNKKTLIALKTKYQPEDNYLYAIFAKQHYTQPKLRLFLDYLYAGLAK